MAEVHTLLHMSRAEAEALRRLIARIDRLEELTADPLPRPDYEGARLRALQAMFHDVCAVLDSGQRQRLLDTWRSQVSAPLWLPEADSDQFDPESLEGQAGQEVLLAAVCFLERVLDSRDNG